MSRDPIEEFFEGERARIRELPGGDERWRAVVASARSSRRRRWPAYVAGVAAAGLVAATVVNALEDDRSKGVTAATSSTRPAPSGTPQPTGTAVVPPGPKTPTRSAAPGPERATTTTTPTALPVPKTFSLVSMSNAGRGHLFALGSARCGSTECTAVVASDDDGRTWTTRASFPGFTAPRGLRNPQGPAQLSGIRFADERVGYVFGSTVRRTTDGGRTWSELGGTSGLTLSLETDGDRVWMVQAKACRTADLPRERGCRQLAVRTARIVDPAVRQVATPALPARVETAWLVLDGDVAYLNAWTTEGQEGALPVRVSESPAALRRPKACQRGRDMWISVSAGEPGHLVGVCPADRRADTDVAVVASFDSGQSWATRSMSALGAPRGGILLTAPDTEHLVALSPGLPTSASGPDRPRTIRVSSDGGATWREAPVGGPGTWVWVGAAGGGLVYAVAGGGTYWTSTDRGATFREQPLRR